MIKWLKCLLWGHEWEEESRCLFTLRKDSNEKVADRYTQILFKCEKCSSFKSESFHGHFE